MNTPKGDNSNTPIRGGYGADKSFPSSSFVNNQRGSRKPLKDNLVSCTNLDKIILEELREFRTEMRLRLDEQIKLNETLQLRLSCAEKELMEVKAAMNASSKETCSITEKAVLTKEQGSGVDHDKVHKNLQKDRNIPSSSSLRVLLKNNQVIDNNYSTSVAMKSATERKRVESVNESISAEYTFQVDDEKKEEGTWITVQKKRNRYPNKEVRKGGSTSIVGIQGTERKKYLHVWRLKKDTSIESIENHVKNICGNNTEIKVEKIKHKTDKDYSSFIITVPESHYNALISPENWAVNIEYCEWVWFRKNYSRTKK
ncbi:uncharacterized protein LOC121737361 [Aricia agestis]|uniref:uncharacterized protein LOC121737361 n=1 Tax=Aricia agestis TaxID=91739 RepID=UPI001C20783A|nr:uncharacterized protein LOC121737361 [Aricia agestis]